jgi:DNA-3-methyladenine glycosylase II
MTARYHLTAPHIRRALDCVAAADADVARAIARVGYPEPRRRPQGFATLLRVIIGQQVSVQAATTIYARLAAAMQEDVRPERLLRLRASRLRKAGLSAAKAKYARCLARAIEREELALDALARMPDDEALQRIQAVPGLGLWSAQIYLMFSLGRPDIWPRADIGVLRGLQNIKRLPERPSAKAADLLAERFSPHRSALALLAWKCASDKPASIASAVPLPLTGAEP